MKYGEEMCDDFGTMKALVVVLFAGDGGDLSGEVFGLPGYADVTACVWNLFSTSESEEPGDVGTWEWRYNV